MNIELFDPTKLKLPNATTSNTADTTTVTAQSPVNSNNTGTSVAESLGLGADFYNDDYNYSVKEAATATKDNKSLFEDRTGFIDTDQDTLNSFSRLANGGGHEQITLDVDGDGTMETVSAAEAMAASFDSELDLYIESEVLNTIGKYGAQFWTGSVERVGFLSQDAIDELAAKGIKVEIIDARTYSFSLVDEEGNVLVDENGNEGSIIFGDWVIPDGYAQGADLHLSSMLDLMGYDCVSRADFIGNEDKYEQVLAGVEARLENGEYHSDGRKTSDIYKFLEETGGAFKSSNGHFSGGLQKGASNSNGSAIGADGDESKVGGQKGEQDGTTTSGKDYKELKEFYKETVEAEMKNGSLSEKEAQEIAVEKVAKIYGLKEDEVVKIVE